MLRLLLGLFCALLASVGFSLLASLLICCAANPETRPLADMATPLLGLFVGAYFASRGGKWRIGFWIGAIYVAAWIEFWMYVMGRWNPVAWITEGLPHLTVTHLIWWGLAMGAAILGALTARSRPRVFLGVMLLAGAGLGTYMFLGGEGDVSEVVEPGFQVERIGPKSAQTTVYLLSFDFAKEKRFRVGLYDCDGDDAAPCDDANTTYMGQSLDGLAYKLDQQAQARRGQLLAVINGGFFGASGFSVAHHEEPIVQDGHVLYNVDLLRPKDQAWFFAANSAMGVLAGRPRFSMRPSIPWSELGNYETVLGGVRPLRYEGRSLALTPGAGATMLKCARTSVGWSADGNNFYVLVVVDTESEGASQMQRRIGWPHFGGWDVREVQQFWEQKRVPFALLFDGGESTQLAYREAGGDFRYLPSGYQYSYTLGYVFERPLLATLPVLPPGEGRRGVLNYLYIAGPRDGGMTDRPRPERSRGP